MAQLRRRRPLRRCFLVDPQSADHDGGRWVRQILEQEEVTSARSCLGYWRQRLLRRRDRLPWIQRRLEPRVQLSAFGARYISLESLYEEPRLREIRDYQSELLHWLWHVSIVVKSWMLLRSLGDLPMSEYWTFRRGRFSALMISCVRSTRCCTNISVAIVITKAALLEQF
jgi:hypothetical protein